MTAAIIHSNIKTVSDIYDMERKRFHSYQEICERHGNKVQIDPLMYNSIISAIPRL